MDTTGLRQHIDAQTVAAGLDTDTLLAVVRRDKRLEEPAKGLPVEVALEELRRRQAIRDTAPAAAPTDQALAEADGTIAPPTAGITTEAHIAAGNLKPVDEPAQTGEPGPLETAGFMALRGQVMNGASAIESLPPQQIDTLLEFAEAARRRARLKGAPRQQLDAVDADVEVLKAVRHFRLELKRIGESAAARQAIAGPMGVQR